MIHHNERYSARSIAVDAVKEHGRNVLHDQTVPRNAGIGRRHNQLVYFLTSKYT